MIQHRVCKCGKPATASIMVNGLSARLCPDCADKARANTKAFVEERDFNTDLASFRAKLYKEGLVRRYTH